VTEGLSFQSLLALTPGHMGVFDAACPLCGPDRQASANQRRKVLRIWHVSPGFIGWTCARCGETGWTKERSSRRVNPSTLVQLQAAIRERETAEAAARRATALRLWRRRRPIIGSYAERYLREARCYSGPLPATVGFLPAWRDFPPAMMAAFGFPRELEPGNLAIADHEVQGVHITKLTPDGRDRDRSERAKIMIGPSRGTPIVLTPPNDLLGIVIAEGIEDALSAHEATGLGAWAAGAASRLPGLADAVPPYVECVTIIADDDAAGRKGSEGLAQALRARALLVRLAVPPAEAA